MQEPQKEKDFHEFKDLRVLSVPVGKTYALVTEHNFYSCPVSHPENDLAVDAFAPRCSLRQIEPQRRLAPVADFCVTSASTMKLNWHQDVPILGGVLSTCLETLNDFLSTDDVVTLTLLTSVSLNA